MGSADETRVLNILEQTLRLSREEREGYVQRACHGDDQLYQAVTVRLEHSDAAVSAITAINQGIPDNRGAALTDIEYAAGQTIGPYHLIKLLGEGGMGRVFLAEQNEPVTRRVALKLIKLGMDTREVLSRFESERAALAMLNHPNVASALDAGTTSTGRPYFVMEYVDGEPINSYADERRFTVDERLALFVQACDGIQHAHQKGIIHRDLKPNNILITRRSGRPLAKIIDFGIAKSTEQKLVEETFFTRFGVFIGTPSYMSPEQAGPDPYDIDTRSDVYALGVLLYELLTGTQPFESDLLNDMSLGELQRLIREQDPPTPAERARAKGPKAEKHAARRRMDIRGLHRRLKGDLSWIVMKALAKSRSERYPSAAAMAEDIRRHLDGEPVEAGPPGQVYRLGKFMGRHKVLVISSTITALALIGGLMVSGWALMETRQARQAAEAQADVTRATNALLYEMFVPGGADSAMDDPVEGQGQPLDESIDRLLDRLDAGTAFAGPEFTGLSGARARSRTLAEVELAIRTLVADRDLALGRIARATRQYDDAARLARELHGPDSQAWFDARARQAQALAGEDGPGAARIYRQVINRGTQKLGQAHPTVLAAQFALAELHLGQGKPELARGLLEEALIRNATSETADLRLEARMLTGLAQAADALGHSEKAAGYINAAREQFHHLYGATSVQAGAASLRQARWLLSHNRVQDAVGHLREAYGVYHQHFGYETVLTAVVQLDLVRALVAIQRWDEAESEAVDLFAGLRGVGMQADPVRQRILGEAMAGLVDIHLLTQRWPDARTWARQALLAARRAMGERQPSGVDPEILVTSLVQLGELEVLLGDPGEAKALLAEARDIRGTDSSPASRSLSALTAFARARMGQPAQPDWPAAALVWSGADVLAGQRLTAEPDGPESAVLGALTRLGQDEDDSVLVTVEAALHDLRSRQQPGRTREQVWRHARALLIVDHRLRQHGLVEYANAYHAELAQLTGQP